MTKHVLVTGGGGGFGGPAGGGGGAGGPPEFSPRRPGMQAPASRFHWIAQPGEAPEAARRLRDEPAAQARGLWGYVDVRDVAQACRLGLTADVRGAEVCIIAAADTVMARPSRELMDEVFPGVPLREGLAGGDTLLSIAKARALLGYAPAHSWRHHVAAPR